MMCSSGGGLVILLLLLLLLAGCGGVGHGERLAVRDEGRGGGGEPLLLWRDGQTGASAILSGGGRVQRTADLHALRRRHGRGQHEREHLVEVAVVQPVLLLRW